MQREACWTSRGAGGAEFVHGNGYLAAAYRHRSSRDGDPQLHTHVLIANATQGPDGRWTRLYHPAIYDHAKTAGYLYEAHLRHELSRSLGVRWQEVRNGIAEIEGFADYHLRAFSTRRAEILEAAGRRRLGPRPPDRQPEHPQREGEGLSTGEPARALAGKATEVGLDRDAIAATLGAEVELKAQLTLDRLDRQVTAHASHFDRRDAMQAVAELAPQRRARAEVESVADAFLASDAVIRISETAKGERFTTQRIWELERQALESAEQMAPPSRAGWPAS